MASSLSKPHSLHNLTGDIYFLKIPVLHEHEPNALLDNVNSICFHARLPHSLRHQPIPLTSSNIKQDSESYYSLIFNIERVESRGSYIAFYQHTPKSITPSMKSVTSAINQQKKKRKSIIINFVLNSVHG